MKLVLRRYDLPRSARQIVGISGALAILLGATGWGVKAANLSGPSNRAAQAGVRDVRERTQEAVRRTEGRTKRLRPKQSSNTHQSKPTQELR